MVAEQWKKRTTRKVVQRNRLLVEGGVVVHHPENADQGDKVLPGIVLLSQEILINMDAPVQGKAVAFINTVNCRGRPSAEVIVALRPGFVEVERVEGCNRYDGHHGVKSLFQG